MLEGQDIPEGANINTAGELLNISRSKIPKEEHRKQRSKISGFINPVVNPDRPTLGNLVACMLLVSPSFKQLKD